MVAYVLCDWNQMHAGHTEELLKGKLPESALCFMRRRGEAGLLLRIKYSNRIKASRPLPLETVSKASVFLSSSPISSLVISQPSPCKGSCLSWCFSAWCDLTQAGIWLNCYPTNDFFNYYIYLVGNTCACGNRGRWRNQLSPEGPGDQTKVTFTRWAFHQPPGKVLKHAHKPGTHDANITHCLGDFFSILISKNRPSEVYNLSPKKGPLAILTNECPCRWMCSLAQCF